jgi:hypothetical protein
MPVGTWVSISTSRNAQDAPVSQDWGNDVVNDLNYLYNNSLPTTAAGSAPIIPNGSFEADAPASSPQTPSGWTNLVLGTGATGAVSNAQQNDGAQSFVFTRDATPGHSGGSLTSGYLYVSPSLAYDLIFMNMNTRADVENQIIVNWYTAALSPISSTVVYDSGLGANAPTVWTPVKVASINPPTNAVQATITINAGITAQTPALAASMYFDGFGISKTTTPSGAYNSIRQILGGPTTVTVPPGAWMCEMFQNNTNGGGDWGSAQSTFVTAHFPVVPGTTIYINSSLDAVYNGLIFGFNNFCDARNVFPKAGITVVPNQVILTFRP